MIARLKRWICDHFGHRWAKRYERCWHGDAHLSARISCPIVVCLRCGWRLL